MNRSKNTAVAGWALILMGCFLFSGCAFQHAAKGPSIKNIRVYPDRECKVVGFVHAESWCPALFYNLKLGNASLDKSLDRLTNEVKAMGGDDVVNVKNNAEVHMPFPLPFILGWHEYHVWGMVVKYDSSK